MAITSTRRATTTSHSVAHLVAVVAPYAALVLIPVVLLAPWFGAVLDRDEGAYAAVAMGMRDGLVPYRDLFDHKPPLIFIVYYLAFLVDDSFWSLRLFAALSLGATSVLVAHAARSLRLGAPAAWFAGAVCALSATNVYLQANANTEIFLLPAMTASFLLTIRARDATPALAAGLFAGIAVLFKSSAAFPAAVLIAWLLVADRQPRQALSFAAGVALPIAATLAAFAALGALDDFWYGNVTYNQLYADVISPGDRLRGIISMNRTVLTGGLGFWLLALFGIAAAVRDRSRESLLLLCWAAACWGSVKFTGRDHAHYYVQLIPVAALLAGCAAQWFVSADRGRFARGAATVGLSALVLWQAAIYASAVSTAERRAVVHSLLPHLQPCETAAPAIGAWLAANTVTGDRVYNLGRDSSIYYYAGIAPTIRFFYDRPFYLDKSTAVVSAADLQRQRPRYIVDTTASCGEGSPAPAELSAVTASGYAPVATIETGVIYELTR